MSENVYFLGAGATIAAAPEAPLNETLVKNAITNFIKSQEAQYLLDFIADLFKNRTDPPINNQIWNLLDYIIQKGKSASPKYNLEKIIDLRKNLLNLVIKEFQNSLEVSEPRIFELFVEKIHNQNPAIISTNYDILIDKALLKKTGLNYGTKIRAMVIGEFDEESGLKRPGKYQTGIGVNKGGIPLFKIHGSLNWLYCSKCDEADITMDKGAVRTLTEDYYCFNRKCTNRYESLLITPTMFKNYDNRLITETWDYAEKALVDAKNLIFIGYALKDEDYQIRCLLMKALLTKKEPYQNIVVVEKEPKDKKEHKYLEENVKKKYENLYGRVDFRPIGFTKYIDSLI